MYALRIIYPPSSYQEALQLVDLARLEGRRNELCIRTFDQITRQALVKTSYPIRPIHNYSLRNSNSWKSFKCRTERFKRSFFPSTIPIANVISSKS